MKNLLFYTLHRQIDEIEYSSFFFNNSDFLKDNFEVILHCNNLNITYSEIKKKAQFKTKTEILITSKNSGYQYGHLEAISDCFEIFKQYDTIIHLHPDCYIVNDCSIKNIIPIKFDVAVSKSKCMYTEFCYNTDFFIFKTKNNFIGNNFIIFDNPDYAPEKFLYEKLNSSNLSVVELNRYLNIDNISWREIDNIGLWHEHDNLKVLNMISELKK